MNGYHANNILIVRLSHAMVFIASAGMRQAFHSAQNGPGRTHLPINFLKKLTEMFVVHQHRNAALNRQQPFLQATFAGYVRQSRCGATRLESLKSVLKELPIGTRRRQILANVTERSSDQPCGSGRRKLFCIRRRKHRFKNSSHVVGFRRRKHVRLIVKQRAYAAREQFALNVL